MHLAKTTLALNGLTTDYYGAVVRTGGSKGAGIINYVITRQELEEADSLCHGNWIEIQRKNQYIQTLQEILDSNHISYPDEI